MSPRQPLSLIKLGGSLITDKAEPETPRTETIARLAAEIAAGRASDRLPLIVGHGSGSFGHSVAAEFGISQGGTTEPSSAGVSATQSAAHRLHRLVVASLADHGVLPYSLPPSSWCVVDEGEVTILTMEPLCRALDLGLVPVVCGDVLLDRQYGSSIASTESVLVALARRLEESGDFAPARALWFGNTAGVLDSVGATIPRLDPDQVDLDSLRRPEVPDVTGGIHLRLAATQALARLGVTSLIADGRQPGLVQRALAGEACPGTLVPADPRS